MSNSIAAAKRRRAGVVETTPPPPPSPSSQDSGQIPSRLTLPQVISMLDARLARLEKAPTVAPTAEPSQVIDTPEGSVSVSDYVVEMDHKFGVLVEEITTLKDIVLKLQAYTMDVNKMLVDERINITSKFQPSDKTAITLEALESSV
jgi:hypothetical protein